jgi:hypothetical protein
MEGGNGKDGGIDGGGKEGGRKGGLQFEERTFPSCKQVSGHKSVIKVSSLYPSGTSNEGMSSAEVIKESISKNVK